MDPVWKSMFPKQLNSFRYSFTWCLDFPTLYCFTFSFAYSDTISLQCHILFGLSCFFTVLHYICTSRLRFTSVLHYVWNFQNETGMTNDNEKIPLSLLKNSYITEIWCKSPNKRDCFHLLQKNIPGMDGLDVAQLDSNTTTG